MNPLETSLPGVVLGEEDPVTGEAVMTTLRRALDRVSTLQAHDGHWPGDYAGLMFDMPIMVSVSTTTFIISVMILIQICTKTIILIIE